jgi:hypothetical protein
MKKLIVSAIGLFALATSAFAEIGSVDKDLVFTPVTPCRIIDTRLAIGQIPAGNSYGFYAGGISTFAAQGGSATDCGINVGFNSAAVAVNFTVVSPAAAGFITVYPFNGTQPTASTLNYTAGAVVGNSAIVKVSQATYTAMSIYSSATTHVVADVVGYYSKPVATALECVDVQGPAPSPSVPANGYQFIPIAACAAGYTSVGVNFAAGARVVKADSGRDYLYVLNLNSIAQTVTPFTNCCRIPGR